jgi:AP-3 complex subunit mu
VPDLLMTLSVPSGTHAIPQIVEHPTFHPCVRLARWHDHPGELSFVPPDGKFMLAGYEVNLLPGSDMASHTAKALNLPALVEVATSLGPSGADFEVRLTLSPLTNTQGSSASLAPPSRSERLGASHSRGPSSGRSTPNSFFASLTSVSSSGTATAPAMRDVEVTIPLPTAVRNVTDLRASRGEATFAPTEHEVSWRLSVKEAGSPGVATLKCSVVGPLGGESSLDDSGDVFDAANGEYVADDEIAYQAGNLGSSNKSVTKAAEKEDATDDERTRRRVLANKALMPTAAMLSFSVQGWLPSGVRVASLNIDHRRSRGLNESVRPVKGAKYIAISRRGVETRC